LIEDRKQKAVFLAISIDFKAQNRYTFRKNFNKMIGKIGSE